MSKEKIGLDWKPTQTGILLPPGSAAPEPAIERAVFAVKVGGFVPSEVSKFEWDGKPVSQISVAYESAANSARPR